MRKQLQRPQEQQLWPLGAIMKTNRLGPRYEAPDSSAKHSKLYSERGASPIKVGSDSGSLGSCGDGGSTAAAASEYATAAAGHIAATAACTGSVVARSYCAARLAPWCA